MREYRGHFEVHLTARADADRFAGWCRGRGLKCVRIVLARGHTADQPMATWRRSATVLSAVLAEADRVAAEAAADGFAVVRVKVEADPHNADVPADDADAAGHDPGCYFEHHVKLRRDPSAPRDGLLAVCDRHAAHLSRNAFRDGGDSEERFVTQRAYRVGRATALTRLDRLLADLRGLGEAVVEHESEFCVSDSNLRLDAGWLPGGPASTEEPDMAAPPDPELPFFVPVELLYRLTLVVSSSELVVPVVRGSLLLRQWYGRRARRAADLDLEVFLSGADRGTRFTSAVDHVRELCSLGAEHGRWPGSTSAIQFNDPDEDGEQSLWTYGTPGERFFAGYTVDGAGPPARFQIDIAHAGPYTRGEIGVADQPFVTAGGTSFRMAAYPREAMLAAKVSWLVRGFSRSAGGRPVWAGEPKDLFDAHLLASDPTLRPDVFRRAMLAIGNGDGLNWNALDVLFDVRRVAVADADFGNWAAFARRHPDLVTAGPAALWAELADRLEPLLGDLYPSAELPFLSAANADPADPLPLLVYADWLDDRGDPRGRVVRLVADRGPRRELVDALDGVSAAWLHQLFGTAARLRSFRETARPPATG